MRLEVGLGEGRKIDIRYWNLDQIGRRDRPGGCNTGPSRLQIWFQEEAGMTMGISIWGRLGNDPGTLSNRLRRLQN